MKEMQYPYDRVFDFIPNFISTDDDTANLEWSVLLDAITETWKLNQTLSRLSQRHYGLRSRLGVDRDKEVMKPS